MRNLLVAALALESTSFMTFVLTLAVFWSCNRA